MGSGAEWTVVVWGAAILISASAALWVLRQRRRDRLERARMSEVEAQGLHIPATLHPVIDPDRCISSAACVSACPEGDVIGLVGGAGRLIKGAACIGHGRCAVECPVDAIQLVFGTAERGQDIPHLSADFETSRAGVYIAGELGGMGLIRNAIRQGVGAARAALRHTGTSDSDRLDLVIVGAGPAGLGAGLACAEARASYALIEQEESFGGTVAHYPRQKLVMTEPVEVPLFGRIHRSEMTKEQLLALWQEVIADTGLEIQCGTRLEDIRGEDGDFEVITNRGSLRARKVVLAIGRHGSPRKLGVPGEDDPRVCYGLTEPEQYRGRDVVVFGGGDSALEAAATLVSEANARVTLCYRGDAFYRAKEKNRTLVEQLAGTGALTVRLKSNAIRLDAKGMHLDGLNEPVAADYVVAALGGVPPTGLLEKLNIRLDRWFGAPPAGQAASTRLAVSDRSNSGLGPAGVAQLTVGLGSIAIFAWLGREYYPLGAAAREGSPHHDWLRPSGLWGHGIGVIATVVMLTNFLYAARKRVRGLRRVGSIRRWLTVHVIVGLLTPPVIAFHAAFQSKNLIATSTYVAVAAVVTSGVLGRWMYGRIQTGRFALVDRFKRMLRVWRFLHVALAVLMVITIVIHVGISWVFGYRWIF